MVEPQEAYSVKHTDSRGTQVSQGNLVYTSIHNSLLMEHNSTQPRA